MLGPRRCSTNKRTNGQTEFTSGLHLEGIQAPTWGRGDTIPSNLQMATYFGHHMTKKKVLVPGIVKAWRPRFRLLFASTQPTKTKTRAHCADINTVPHSHLVELPQSCSMVQVTLIRAMQYHAKQHGSGKSYLRISSIELSEFGNQ